MSEIETQPLAKTTALTIVTLVAFAANSVLCRLALVETEIDPASFTAIRLGSGALVLMPWVWRSRGAQPWDLRAGGALLLYAVPFSFAYLWLDAGTGALLLFGCVQLTMFATGVARRERVGPRQVCGMLLAFGGVVWLVRPGVSAPPPGAALLMGLAGVMWGAYSLLGRGARDPAGATGRNFILAAPLALVVALIGTGTGALDSRGVTLAISSGALTSGLGYVLWYSALRGHTRTSAAVVQLLVPLIAALGGVVFSHEEWTLRFGVAAAFILGGVGMALRGTATPNAESGESG